jgi:hypothetical protein
MENDGCRRVVVGDRNRDRGSSLPRSLDEVNVLEREVEISLAFFRLGHQLPWAECRCRAVESQDCVSSGMQSLRQGALEQQARQSQALWMQGQARSGSDAIVLWKAFHRLTSWNVRCQKRSTPACEAVGTSSELRRARQHGSQRSCGSAGVEAHGVTVVGLLAMLRPPLGVLGVRP